MLIVETVTKIRRAYFLQKKPIKAICREFHLSRKVVRKVIRSDAIEFRYEREQQPFPRVGPWREQLEAVLLENEVLGTARVPARYRSRDRVSVVAAPSEIGRFSPY